MENRSQFTVKKMCQVMKVSQSGYYRWQRQPISKRKVEKQLLQRTIKELFAKPKGMAGSPMITADLHDHPDFSTVSRQRVARLMKEMGFIRQTSTQTKPLALQTIPRRRNTQHNFFLSVKELL